MALEDTAKAQTYARQVIQTAGSRGLKLLNLEARAVMSHVAGRSEAATHRVVAQELARDFTSALSPDMVAAFSARPWIQWLDDPEDEDPSA